MYKEQLKKVLPNRPSTYKEFLAANGIDNEAVYKNAVAKINADTRRAAESTSFAEALDRQGMTSSGYADYMRGARAAKQDNQISGAYENYMKSEYQAGRDYDAYIDNYELLQKKEQDELIEYLKKNRIFDRTDAYEIIRNSELTPDNAYDVLTRGVMLARRKAIDEAVSISVARMYSFYAARRYALAVGLSAEDAYEVAKKTLDYHNDDATLDDIYNDSYIEHLENRLEAYKQYGKDKLN